MPPARSSRKARALGTASGAPPGSRGSGSGGRAVTRIQHRAARLAQHYGSTRLAFVDLVRGLAVALMLGYHFCYDLNHFHFVGIDFYGSPLLQGARVLILSLFLGVMGMSLYLATADGIRWRPYLQRLLLLLLAVALVSVGSYLVFPERWIHFGVLHLIVVASILGLAFLPLRVWNAPLGLVVILVGTTVESTWFDRPWLQWIGLMTYKPPTEDYVPVLPWFGVVLLGTAAARILYGGHHTPAFAMRDYTSVVSSALIGLGRHSLLIYLLHQPIFMAILFVADTLRL